MYCEYIFFNSKIMFYFENVKIFMLLMNPETSKSVTSSQTLLHIRSYTYECFFRILVSLNMKFGQINTRDTHFQLGHNSILKTRNKLLTLLLTLILIKLWNNVIYSYLTLQRTRFPSYRNQSVDLLCKSTDWFLYDKNIGR